ncbi:helix-turn-helix transcriptional regulator [Listeria aquatica]|uniref:helix-turn-helix domain-containing protein n=1 Tax=Listeria aquatica TaxID=1494960 RepID=UPI0031F5C3DE
MKSIGETIKFIRENKHIKQSELKTVSQSTLAHVENSGRLPRIDIFENILLELNTNKYEFDFFRNDFKLPERDKLFEMFRNQKQSFYEDYIYELIEKFDDYIDRHPDDYFIKDLRHLLDINLKVNKTQSYEVANEETYAIWDRYDAQDEFLHHNELYIMTKLFFTFPIQFSKKKIDKILKQFNYFSEFQNMATFKMSFLLNCSFYYISYGKFEELVPYATEAKNIAHAEQLSITELSADYCLAYKLFHDGKIIEASNEIKRITRLLDELNYPIHASDFKETGKTSLILIKYNFILKSKTPSSSK